MQFRSTPLGGRKEFQMPGLFPSNFSNLVHKLPMDIAVLRSIIGGFKESNRRRISTSINTSTGAYVVTFIAPWAGTIEGLLVASATPTTSSNGNSVTFTVNDLTSSAALLTADSFVSGQELVANTGVLFSNAAPAMSNGARAQAFAAGDVIEVKGVTNGSPSGYTAGVTNIQLVVVPVDPHAAF